MAPKSEINSTIRSCPKYERRGHELRPVSGTLYPPDILGNKRWHSRTHRVVGESGAFTKCGKGLKRKPPTAEDLPLDHFEVEDPKEDNEPIALRPPEVVKMVRRMQVEKEDMYDDCPFS